MPEHLVKMFFDMYREAAEKFGYTSSPYQLGHLLPVYVAETDARAEEEAAAHIRWLYYYGLRHKQEFLFPPGYVSLASMKSIIQFAPEMDWERMSFRELNDKGFCVVGSAATVRQRLAEYAKTLGFGIMPILFQSGDMPHHKVIKNMDMFAAEVMPHLRAEFKERSGWAKAA
jgi:alkanesulfonate monooxygenase SsuD/methylene tetrahydromethanopterin reductase-like flavin-dependent oxidoreductase (luciferase family)